jgi:hypothetical protein
MVNDQLQFNERLQLLARKHRAMSHGYSTYIQPDGLIVARPRRRAIRISGRAVIMFVLAFIGFKAFLIANLGMLTYEERVTRLQSGTVVERAGAFAMQPDPLSTFVALQVGPILR